MSKADQIFRDVCLKILNDGVSDEGMDVRPRWDDGTPAYTKKIFGVVNRYNLQEEFPIMTLRRTYWKSALEEILWIYQKKSNNINDLNSHIWDQWADDTGSIGKAYGYQMSVKHPVANVDPCKVEKLFGANSVLYVSEEDFDANPNARLVIRKDGKMLMDQVDKVLYDLKFNPTSRRIITTTFIPSDLTEMHLAPCAYSMTFNVSGNVLNAILNQRSQDMLAASNWNVVQYAMLTHMIAQVSGLKAGELVHVISDCHIYDRHIPLVEKILENEPMSAPKFWLDPDVKDFYNFSRESVRIDDYCCHEFKDKIPVAV